MSEYLATVDLSQIPVNGTGSIDLSQVKTAYSNPGEQSPAHIRLYNESGSALRIRSDNGVVQDFIPAGGWPTYAIDHSVQAIDFTVISILPSPSIQLLMPTYFAPGEEVPATPQLGNSPIGGNLSGNVAASIDNENSAFGTEIIRAVPLRPPLFNGGQYESMHAGNDGTFTLTSPAASTNVTEQNFNVVNGTTLSHGHVEMDAAKIKTDGTGGLQVSKPDILQTGNQETGKCGGNYSNCTNGQAVGPVVNGKTQWTNAPSSITFSNINGSNQGGPSASLIDVYGFNLFWTATGAAGAVSQMIANYTTVGN